MNYSRAIGPYKKKIFFNPDCFGINAINLYLKVLIYFLLERLCSKHERSNSWLEIRIPPSRQIN